jgi:hypothetical protein
MLVFGGRYSSSSRIIEPSAICHLHKIDVVVFQLAFKYYTIPILIYIPHTQYSELASNQIIPENKLHPIMSWFR